MVALALALVATPAVGSVLPAPAELGVGRYTPGSDLAPADGVSAVVTWDGTNVSAAGTTSAAFPIDAGQSVLVAFDYAEAAGTPAVDNASLLLEFAGIALSIESIRTAPVGLFGAAAMNWTFGSLIYLTEGAYEVDAELLDANGSVLFREAFFVDARAPYVVASVILDMAIVLGLVEALWIRSVIRYRRRRRGRYRYR